jgi:dTDP-4-amino-4,6-dideoxygalactose transaminase
LLDDKNLDGYFYDKECTKPIYKIEHKGRLQVEMKPNYIRTETFSFVKPKFNITEDVKDKILALPVHQDLPESAFEYMAKCVKDFASNQL